MNNSNNDIEEVSEGKTQENKIEEVTKMSATSTTSSNEGEQMISDLHMEILKKKKKKLFLSKEMEQAENSRLISTEAIEPLEAMKTNIRISQELPKCNWLEDKIYDSELAKRAQECRRLIDEELSRRKSISNRSEPENCSSETSVQEEDINFPDNLREINETGTGGDERKTKKGETNQEKRVTEKSNKEIQDNLMKEKQALLKDIRIIQKRKIKEMEELIDIKLKKENYEQELEDTRTEIKKMDVYFENIRKRKSNQDEEKDLVVKRANSIEENNEKNDSDIKIIDIKTKEGVVDKKRGQMIEEESPRKSSSYNCQNKVENSSTQKMIDTYQADETISHPSNQDKTEKVSNMNNRNTVSTLKHIQQDTQSVHNLTQTNVRNEGIRIRANIMEAIPEMKNKEKLEIYKNFNQSMPSLAKTSDMVRPSLLEQSRPVVSNQMQCEKRSPPLFQQRKYHEAHGNFEQSQRLNSSVKSPLLVSQSNEGTRSSPISDNFSRASPREVPNDTNRASADPKQFYSHSFQPYKPQRKQENYNSFPPQLQQVREYKDAILIPINKPITRNEAILPSKEQFIRELEENEKQQYHRAMQLQSPPQYQTVNSIMAHHEAMLNMENQRYRPQESIPMRPIPSISRIHHPNHNQVAFFPFHEHQSAHFQHLSMQSRRDIERYTPHIAQEVRRPNIPIKPTKPALPDEKCEACGKEANFMCSACKGAHYCSTVCQRESWSAHCNKCVKL